MKAGAILELNEYYNGPKLVAIKILLDKVEICNEAIEAHFTKDQNAAIFGTVFKLYKELKDNDMAQGQMPSQSSSVNNAAQIIVFLNPRKDIMERNQ